MAPSRRQPPLLKVLLAYMNKATEQEFRRYSKKIAASTEFKSLLLQLAELSPSTMRMLLKLASRKCEDALCLETATKRKKQPNSNERSSKRARIAHSTGKETPSDRRIPGMDLMMQVHVTQQEPQNAHRDDQNEDSEEEDESKENELAGVATPSISVPQGADTPHSLTEYEIERGLTVETPETPTIIAYVTARLLTLKPSMTRSNFNINNEITKVLSVLPDLEAETTKRGLIQYLNNRKEMPGGKVQAPITWNVSSPGEIIHVLECVKANSKDNDIHRAYGQTMLFSSVNAQVAKGYKSTFAGHRADHTALLEDLARKNAGPVSKSEIDQTIKRYKSEYYAGQKWLAVIDWFGGSGTVLVFVIAEIAIYKVYRDWTEFQRSCLQHIAALLPSIRALVAALGSDALEAYCQHGCLDQACIDRVASAQFTKHDGDDEESEDDEE